MIFAVRRFLHRSLLVGAGMLAAPAEAVRADTASEEIEHASRDSGDELFAYFGHVSMTRAIDIACPSCGVEVGVRCGPALCRDRIMTATKRTREANRQARGSRLATTRQI